MAWAHVKAVYDGEGDNSKLEVKYTRNTWILGLTLYMLTAGTMPLTATGPNDQHLHSKLPQWRTYHDVLTVNKAVMPNTDSS